MDIRGSMKIISKRKTDVREVWIKDDLNDDESLIIPPCDLWHDPDQLETKNKTVDKPPVKRPIQSEKGPSQKKNDSGMNSQCWAFMGTVGGVGTTSLAVQLAYELAKNHKGRSRQSRMPQVCLIDLDFESGRCIHQLDIQPSLSIEDLNNDALHIDAAFTEALMTPHESGINVLATPNLIGANSKVNCETVIALLDVACNLYPYVILDVPYHWQEWSLAALGGSDFVGLVTNSTIPSLHVTQSKHAQLSQMFEGEKSFEIILNKYERRTLKKNLSLKDVQTALHKNVYGTICNDPDASREALNCGAPIGAIRPDSRYAKNSRKLLNLILSKVHDSQHQCVSHERMSG